MRKTFILVHPAARSNAIETIRSAPDGCVVEVRKSKRTLAQNARMWAMLTDISDQVIWHGRKMEPEEWKHVFTAALRKQDVVPGIDGGFVVLGLSTSSMTTTEMSDLMEFMAAFGAERGVNFSVFRNTYRDYNLVSNA